MTAQALQIRQVEGFDIPVLTALHAACFTASWDQPWTHRSFVEVLQMPGSGAYIAALGEEPIGFAVACVVADEAELLLIGIHPDHRRDGNGRALLDHLCAVLRRAGIARLFLEVAESNPAAVALYGAAGFERVGRRAKYYEGGGDALVLRKALRADIVQPSK